MNNRAQTTYRQIFKSTSLICGTQVITILIGVLRTKALAMLLGPSGVGIAGMYTSTMSLVGTFFGFGIRSAGVRQIAEAVGTGDETRVARTVMVLRRASLWSGVLGMVLAMALHRTLSRTTFGDAEYAGGMALVSLTLLLGGISDGQLALLQGMRKLKELAQCTILGAVFGALTSVALVYLFRERGIALYLVAGSAFAGLASWWLARKVPVKQVKLTLRATLSEARTLLALGGAFMISSLFSACSAYLIRILVRNEFGMDAVGLYTATVTLSSLYVGMVLSAMGADFYPRLTAVSKDNPLINRLVNEQTELGLLIALPGVLATLVFAPWIFAFFYSSAFLSATDIVRWQILGVGVRVVGWPLGFVLLAKGMARQFMFVELFFTALNLGLSLVCVRIWGLKGLGIAFLLLYLGYACGMLWVCRAVTGFGWSRRALLFMFGSTVAVILLLLTLACLPEAVGMVVGGAQAVLSALVCLYLVQRLLRINLIQVATSKCRSLLCGIREIPDSPPR